MSRSDPMISLITRGNVNTLDRKDLALYTPQNENQNTEASKYKSQDQILNI